MHVLHKRLLLLMLSVLETLQISVYVVTWRVQWCPMPDLIIGESACRFDHTLLSDFRLGRPQRMLEICSQTSVDLPWNRPNGLFLSSHSSSSCSACNNPNNVSKTGKLKRNNNKLITSFSTFKKKKVAAATRRKKQRRYFEVYRLSYQQATLQPKQTPWIADEAEGS